MKQTLLIALALVPSLSFAAELTVAEMLAATKVAVEDFIAQNPAHADHFTGYKVWKSGDEAKAKIYVNHHGSNMDFNYDCHRQDTKIECQAQ